MREAIILAGGLGTRLRSVLDVETPKAMAPVSGRPFLEWILSLLRREGFARVVLALGYRAESIRAHFGQCWGGLELAYSIEPQPLGTGGAIRLALLQSRADPVHVLNGDTWVEPDVSELESLWALNRETVIVAQRVEDTSRYGRIELDADARILAFGEKTAGGPGLINAGWYLLGHDALAAHPGGSAFSIETDVLAPAAHAGKLRASIARGAFIDIGIPGDYARAEHALSRGSRMEERR